MKDTIEIYSIYTIYSIYYEGCDRDILYNIHNIL